MASISFSASNYSFACSKSALSITISSKDLVEDVLLTYPSISRINSSTDSLLFMILTYFLSSSSYLGTVNFLLASICF